MYLTIDAQDVVLELVAPGTTVGEDTVPEGKVGLTFGANGDTVLVIGTPQQLRTRVVEGFGLPVPDGVSLFDVEGV